MTEDPTSMEEVVDALDELGEKSDDVSIGDVLDEFGGRSYGPFLIIPALLEITPLGGIPGVPTFLAVIIALVAAQMLFGKEHIWMPHVIQNRSVTGGKLQNAAGKLDGVAAFMDKFTRGRLKIFAGPMAEKVAALVILALAASVLPLEFVPFASTAPMAAIVIFGLALMVRDGLMMLIATGASVAVFIFGLNLLGGASGTG